MTGRTKWSTLRDELLAKPGAKEAIASARAQSLEEIRLYELRHAEAVSQVEMAGRLEVTQGAISKFEHADDVRVSTLREYLEALGARLELVAVFDEEERRVPVHLGAATRSGSGQQGDTSEHVEVEEAQLRATNEYQGEQAITSLGSLITRRS